MSSYGQNQPLPPGWEAKYDPNSQRYFFINHATRETSWKDPRTNYAQPQYGYGQQQYYQQQQQPYQQPQPSHAARALSTQRQPSPPTRAFQMTETRVDSSSESENETSLGGDLMGDLVSDSEKQRLLNSIKSKMDLVGVSDDLIITTLDASAYKEDMAISMFQSMGFRLKGQSGSSDQSSNTTSSYEQREAERKRKEEAERKKREEERKRKEREEAERKAREETERRQREEAEKKRKEEAEKKRAAAEKKRKAETEKKRKAEADKKATAKKKEQQGTYDDMQAMLNKAMTDLGAKFDKQKKSPKKTITKPAQSLSVLDAHKKKSTKPLFTPSENQGLKSALAMDGLLIRMNAEGNDPSLVNGSNAHELRTERLETQGRDIHLAVGRQRGLAKGRSRDLAVGRSCAAMGADSYLRIGRDPRLANGPTRLKSCFV